VRLRIAWRLLRHEGARGILAISGISVAILLIFMQLGFYNLVPKSATLVYDGMQFDIALVSGTYVFQASSRTFPRRRLYQALSLPEVAAVAPLYQQSSEWLNPEGRLLRRVFVMGIDLDKPALAVPDIARQHDVLARPNTILVDTATRPALGPLTIGRIVEIARHGVEIGGTYTLGTGFLGLGVVVVSEANFLRIFPDRTLGDINIGLVRLKPGAELLPTVRALRAMLPVDTQVMTRKEVYADDISHWRNRTSTGLVFGLGVVVGVIVGTVILYQMLATQITRYLSQYATLKAIGYSDRYLSEVVLTVALVMTAVAFVPALAVATAAYRYVRSLTFMPLEMSAERVIFVLGLTLFMSAGSVWLSLRRLHQADPADLM
jgi:putative ABC transport system permease protein